MSYHDSRLARLVPDANPLDMSGERLISSHLPLVRKLAWQVHRQVSTIIEIDDLMQIGMVALVEAARSFEDRGLGFANYAKLRVRGAMIDHLRKLSNLSRATMTFRKQLRQARAKLVQRLGYDPDERTVAAELGMDQESFRIAVDNADAVDLKSMDEAYSDQNIWFEDQCEKADEAVERVQMEAKIANAIADLPKRDAMVLQLYFIDEMNLKEIGQTLDIGAARVCQIKKAALKKLQSKLV